MRWFGVSAQLQLLNANHGMIPAHGITSALLMSEQNQYRGQKCTTGRRATIRRRDSPRLQFPWWKRHSCKSVLNVERLPTGHAEDRLTEPLSLPTLVSVPTWLDYVVKFANKMLTYKTKLPENQYQIIACATLEDKSILHITISSVLEWSQPWSPRNWVVLIVHNIPWYTSRQHKSFLLPHCSIHSDFISSIFIFCPRLMPFNTVHLSDPEFPLPGSQRGYLQMNLLFPQ